LAFAGPADRLQSTSYAGGKTEGKAMSTGTEHRDVLEEWTVAWFEARGLQVNGEQMLVSVEGFEPLFHMDDDPGGY
jgi:hypothetical protein